MFPIHGGKKKNETLLTHSKLQEKIIHPFSLTPVLCLTAIYPLEILALLKNC